MKLHLTSISTTILLGSLILNSMASIDKPIVQAGTGCPSDSSIVKKDKDGKTIIFFKQYEAGQSSASGKKRVSCSFAVPITLPVGFRINQVIMEWHGYIEGQGELKRKFFLAGQQPYSGWKSNRHNQPTGGSFITQDKAPLITHCKGGSYNLRINSEVRVADDNQSRLLIERATFVLTLNRC